MKQDIVYDFNQREIVTTRGGNLELISGKPALIQRIKKILHTTANRYDVYFDSGYGNCLENLVVGKTLPSAFLASEIEREVKECIGSMEDVKDVSRFSVIRDGARLTISFFVDSIYGSETITEVFAS